MNQRIDRTPKFQSLQWSSANLLHRAPANDRNSAMNCLQNLSTSVLKLKSSSPPSDSFKSFLTIFFPLWISDHLLSRSGASNADRDSLNSSSVTWYSRSRHIIVLHFIYLVYLCSLYRTLNRLFRLIQVIRNFTDLHRRSIVKVAIVKLWLWKFMKDCYYYYYDRLISFVWVIVFFNQLADWNFSYVWGLV